jgi:hypothetical protein
MNNQQITVYRLQTLPAESGTPGVLCLGERLKKGTIRPSAKTLASTQITGALRVALNDETVWATGYLEKYDPPQFIVVAPRDVVTEVSKVPLLVEVLTNVTGRVFVFAKPGQTLPERIPLRLGAFLSKGFGHCELRRQNGAPDLALHTGALRCRLPESDLHYIGVDKPAEQVCRPIYGYLFRPQYQRGQSYTIRGVYERALLEDSIVQAYRFVVR